MKQVWFVILAILLLPFYPLLKWIVKRMEIREKTEIKDNMLVVLKNSSGKRISLN